jgi:hypothetical protein
MSVTGPVLSAPTPPGVAALRTVNVFPESELAT